LTWRDFWTYYTAAAIWSASRSRSDSLPQPDLVDDLPGDLRTELLTSAEPLTSVRLATLWKTIANADHAELRATSWLRKLDQAPPLGGPMTALFDGLDAGFGNSDSDRQRRTRAIEGLFSWLLDSMDLLQNVRFKVLLREDIWRKLRFPNRSH